MFPLTVVNPGAETGDATGWTGISSFTAIPAALTSVGGGVPPFSGTYSFSAALNAALTWWGQEISIPSEFWDLVDDGVFFGTVEVYNFRFADQTDTGSVNIEFLDSMGQFLSGVYGVQQVNEVWTLISSSVRVPPLSRIVRVSTRGVRFEGLELSTYYDNFSCFLDFTVTKRHKLLYSSGIPTASGGWVQVSGTLTDTKSDLFDQGLSWLSSASGEAYQEINISNIDDIADIDEGITSLSFYFRHSSVSGADSTGRGYIEFRDSLDALIGSRIYSDASEVLAPDAGRPVLMEESIPVGTRNIRIGLVGTRVTGSDIDSLFSRFSVFINGLNFFSSQVDTFYEPISGDAEVKSVSFNTSEAVLVNLLGGESEL